MTFKKGQSGNPSGRPKRTMEEKELIEACKAKAPAAVRRLAKLMNSDNESVALRASIAILERAYGKPRQEVDVSASESQQCGVLLVNPVMSEEEWEKQFGHQSS